MVLRSPSRDGTNSQKECVEGTVTQAGGFLQVQCYLLLGSAQQALQMLLILRGGHMMSKLSKAFDDTSRTIIEYYSLQKTYIPVYVTIFSFFHCWKTNFIDAQILLLHTFYLFVQFWQREREHEITLILCPTHKLLLLLLKTANVQTLIILFKAQYNMPKVVWKKLKQEWHTFPCRCEIKNSNNLLCVRVMYSIESDNGKVQFQIESMWTWQKD